MAAEIVGYEFGPSFRSSMTNLRSKRATDLRDIFGGQKSRTKADQDAQISAQLRKLYGRL